MTTELKVISEICRTCDAPLCPADDKLDRFIWFPGEDICRALTFQKLSWIKKQKTILKKNPDPHKFFNVAMLNIIRQVRKGIAGADPDIEIKKKNGKIISDGATRWITDLLELRQTPKKSDELAMREPQESLKSKLPKKITGSAGISGHVRVKGVKSQG